MGAWRGAPHAWLPPHASPPPPVVACVLFLPSLAAYASSSRRPPRNSPSCTRDPNIPMNVRSSGPGALLWPRWRPSGAHLSPTIVARPPCWAHLPRGRRQQLASSATIPDVAVRAPRTPPRTQARAVVSATSLTTGGDSRETSSALCFFRRV